MLGVVASHALRTFRGVGGKGVPLVGGVGELAGVAVALFLGAGELGAEAAQLVLFDAGGAEGRPAAVIRWLMRRSTRRHSKRRASVVGSSGKREEHGSSCGCGDRATGGSAVARQRLRPGRPRRRLTPRLPAEGLAPTQTYFADNRRLPRSHPFARRTKLSSHPSVCLLFGAAVCIRLLHGLQV